MYTVYITETSDGTDQTWMDDDLEFSVFFLFAGDMAGELDYAPQSLKKPKSRCQPPPPGRNP